MVYFRLRPTAMSVALYYPLQSRCHFGTVGGRGRHVTVISDMDVHRFGKRGRRSLVLAEVVPLAEFLSSLLKLGTAMWQNAKQSREAIKAS
jgi:hypothetical protein